MNTKKSKWILWLATCLTVGSLCAWTPGSDYPTGTGGVPAAVFDPLSGLVPYSANIQVVGRIDTNDAAIFLDRTGRYLRGTNLISLLQGLAPAAINAGMSNYLAEVSAFASDAQTQALIAATLAAQATNSTSQTAANLLVLSNLTITAQAAATNATAAADTAFAAATNATAAADTAFAAGTNAQALAEGLSISAEAGYVAGTNALVTAQIAGTNASAAAATARTAYAAATNAQEFAASAAFSAALAAADLVGALTAATNAQDTAYIALTNSTLALSQSALAITAQVSATNAAAAAQAAYMAATNAAAEASAIYNIATNANAAAEAAYVVATNATTEAQTATAIATNALNTAIGLSNAVSSATAASVVAANMASLVSSTASNASVTASNALVNAAEAMTTASEALNSAQEFNDPYTLLGPRNGDYTSHMVLDSSTPNSPPATIYTVFAPTQTLWLVSQPGVTNVLDAAYADTGTVVHAIAALPYPLPIDFTGVSTSFTYTASGVGGNSTLTLTDLGDGNLNLSFNSSRYTNSSIAFASVTYATFDPASNVVLSALSPNEVDVTLTPYVAPPVTNLNSRLISYETVFEWFSWTDDFIDQMYNDLVIPSADAVFGYNGGYNLLATVTEATNTLLTLVPHVADTNNPHLVTAVQLGALTIEQDLAALAALEEYAETNRVTRLITPDGSQWIDGTGAVWRISTTNLVTWDTSRVIVTEGYWTDQYNEEGSIMPGEIFTLFGTNNLDMACTNSFGPWELYVFSGYSNWVIRDCTRSYYDSSYFPLSSGGPTGTWSSGECQMTTAYFATLTNSVTITSRVDSVALQSDLAPLASAIAPKVDNTDGTATNLTTRGWFALPQSAPTNLVIRLVTSNEHILVQEVYQ